MSNSDLWKEFERLVAEGGVDVSINGEYYLEIEPHYNCEYGNHKIKWYEGYTEHYNFCELCDKKWDKNGRPY